jgi:hypothetical protein
MSCSSAVLSRPNPVGGQVADYTKLPCNENILYIYRSSFTTRMLLCLPFSDEPIMEAKTPETMDHKASAIPVLDFGSPYPNLTTRET